MKRLPGDCFLVYTDSDAKKLSGVHSVSCQSLGDALFFLSLTFQADQLQVFIEFFLYFKWKKVNFSTPSLAGDRLLDPVERQGNALCISIFCLVILHRLGRFS